MRTGPDHNTTESDEFIARALAEQEIEEARAAAAAAAAATARRQQPSNTTTLQMVDTGAESSVISEQLAKELGLHASIDRRAQGIAAGVGQAKIVGQIRNAAVTLGHVEFFMEFMVLQVPTRLMLLGLDQMRKYKCIVNLEKDVLVFGGSGGVEVAMLPPDHQRHLMVPGIGGGCTIS
ncbi:MAG: hypothetical protein SGBAC_009705 [Bacillariaceae sp.]